MEQVYTTYLSILRSFCSGDNSQISVRPEELPMLAQLAKKHFSAPILLPHVRNTAVYAPLKQFTISMFLNYYQMEHFTRHTTALLEPQVPCLLLKGLSLADCYPVPEYRKLGDLDLYINDPDALETAKRILASNGYVLQDEISDHHLTYSFSFPQGKRRFLLELHYQVTGVYQYEPANQVVRRIFSKEALKPDFLTLNEYRYAVLPPTETVFFMLHHMLKHYLYSGFGIRLFLDFVLYLNRHHEQVRFSDLHSWCQESKISHFYELVLETCRLYLGLSESIDPTVHAPKEQCQDLILQVLQEEDMGNETGQQLVTSGSYRTTSLLACLKEGHVQMKVRYPNASRVWIIWPLLWGAAFFHFLKNTYTIRNTTFLQTLRDFRKQNDKTRLIQIFENSDS